MYMFGYDIVVGVKPEVRDGTNHSITYVSQSKINQTFRLWYQNEAYYFIFPKMVSKGNVSY